MTRSVVKGEGAIPAPGTLEPNRDRLPFTTRSVVKGKGAVLDNRCSGRRLAGRGGKPPVGTACETHYSRVRCADHKRKWSSL